MTVHEAVEFACGAVGIHGVLAALHDRFDPSGNHSKYETWPVIQRELIRFDAELRASLRPVEDPIDEEIQDAFDCERFEEHDIVPLCDRVV